MSLTEIGRLIFVGFVIAMAGIGAGCSFAWIWDRVSHAGPGLWFWRRTKSREADRAASWLLPRISDLGRLAHLSERDGFIRSADHFRMEQRLLMAVLHDIEIQLTGDTRTIFIGEGS
jgi:hypothetical protein